jgi:hypothetical protein
MKEKYREIGLTVLFLLFVVGMSTDIPGLLQKEKQQSDILAATSSEPKKISTSPTVAPPTTVWPTWTPTPIPSSPTSIPSSQSQGASGISDQQVETTPVPQQVGPTDNPQNQISPTPIPNVFVQMPPTDKPDAPQFPNDEPGRGGLLDTVNELLDPLDLPL